MKIETLYFEKPGRGNTPAVIEAVRLAASRLRIKAVVLASTTGETALKFAAGLGPGVALTAVTNHAGWAGGDGVALKPGTRKKLEALKVQAVVSSHALSGISRSISKKFGGPNYPELIAATLRLFGEGIKVAVEVAVMAADAGAVPTDRDLIAVGGSGKGADAAVVLRAAHQNNFFELRVREIIAMVRR